MNFFLSLVDASTNCIGWCGHVDWAKSYFELTKTLLAAIFDQETGKKNKDEQLDLADVQMIIGMYILHIYDKHVLPTDWYCNKWQVACFSIAMQIYILKQVY